MASRDKIIAKAEKLVSKGKIEAAIGEYEKVLKDSPNDVNTLNRIGDLWVRVNKPEEAVRVFGEIADHYSRDGFFLKSIAIYKKINKLDPANLDIYSKLAELYAKQGLAMEAKSQYMVLAEAALKKGNNQQALDTYKKIAELDPNSIQVHVKLADLYKATGDTEKALQQYDKVGGMLLRKGMTDEAVQVFEKALKIDPSNLELIASLTGALTEAGQPAEALKMLESARSENPDNAELAAAYGKALLESGDPGKARTVLEEALAVAPADNSTREALGDVYLKEGESDKAFEVLDEVIQAKVAGNDVSGAIAIADRILAADAQNIGVLTRVVDVYDQANQETNIITSLNALAEAHIARGENDLAAQALERILEREPQNAQIRTKLEMVSGGGEAASAPATEPEPATPPAPLEIDMDEGPSIEIDAGPELDLDASPVLEFDAGVDAAVEEVEEVEQVEVEELSVEPETASTVTVGGDLSDEDLTFIAEQMTEAEVFAKYGLTDRSVEHLEKVITQVPSHLPAYEKLMALYLDEGDSERAADAASTYLAKLRESGEEEEIARVEALLQEKGIAPEGAAPTPAAEEPEVQLEEVAVEDEAPVELEFEEEPAEEVSLEFGEEPAEEVSLEVEEPAEEVSLEIEQEPAEEVSLEFDADVSAESVEEPEELDLDQIDLDDVEITLEDDEEPVAVVDETDTEEPEPAEVEVAITSGGEEAVAVDAPGTPVVEPGPIDHSELSEIDFYIGEQLFSEAREKIRELESRHPGAPELTERLQKVEEAETKAAEQPPAEEPAALDIESELSMLLPEGDDEAPVQKAPQPEEPAAVEAAAGAEEEGLFDDEDDFFDLAAELEEELGDDLDEDFNLKEEEQSLEDVFKEFKKGVEEQLDSEDYETHYNLGIAYKEMGLIDEAIGEFQIASKDPGRAVECCSMLGLCFLEKGMPQLSVKWYQKGLEFPELTEDEHLGLLYELANAYEQIGDPASAHKTFVEIYGVNSNYRDVAERIKQLDSVV